MRAYLAYHDDHAVKHLNGRDRSRGITDPQHPDSTLSQLRALHQLGLRPDHVTFGLLSADEKRIYAALVSQYETPPPVIDATITGPRQAVTQRREGQTLQPGQFVTLRTPERLHFRRIRAVHHEQHRTHLIVSAGEAPPA